MSNDKSGSPPCGIYVRIDNFSDMPKTITALRQMTMVINRASGYEKNMSVVEFSYNAEFKTEITDLIALAQNEGMVTIIKGTALDNLLNADGVLLDNVDEIDAVRMALGDDAIIGVMCESRAVVELAIEGGADYVVLAADPALVSWCRAKSGVLCVASGAGTTNDNCGALVRAGASFVDVTDYIFTYEKGVMQSTVNILHAIDMAVQMGKLH